MAYTVLGSLRGVGYELTVPDQGPPTGSGRILAELVSRAGEEIVVTPVGPFPTLDLTDPATVLAALMSWTTIVSVGGDPPAVLPPPPAGVTSVVY